MNLTDIFCSLNVMAANASNGGIWSSFVNFLSTTLIAINNITGNYGISVILFTIIMRCILLPLDLKAKKSTQKMNELQPELEKINKKYKNDQEKRNKKTMELYQKSGINPLGGCLPMLIQMPIFFALFAALRQISNVELGNFLIDLLNNQSNTIGPVLQEIADKVQSSSQIKLGMSDIIQRLFSGVDTGLVENLKEVAGNQNVAVLVDQIKNIKTDDVMQFLQNSNYNSFKFFWIKNVWIADSPLKDVVGRSIPFFSSGYNGMFILSALAGITSYIQMKITNPTSENQQTKSFSTIFPLLSVWFTSMYTAAFGIYWVTSNVFQIIQQLIYNRVTKTENLVKEGAKK